MPLARSCRAYKRLSKDGSLHCALGLRVLHTEQSGVPHVEVVPGHPVPSRRAERAGHPSAAEDRLRHDQTLSRAGWLRGQYADRIDRGVGGARKQAFDYFTKPVGIDTLKASVNRALKTRNLDSEDTPDE
jgi:hypothetical protein